MMWRQVFGVVRGARGDGARACDITGVLCADYEHAYHDMVVSALFFRVIKSYSELFLFAKRYGVGCNVSFAPPP